MDPYTTLLGAIVSIGLLASPAAAQTRLGGISMASACRYQYWDENIQVVQTEKYVQRLEVLRCACGGLQGAHAPKGLR